MGFNDATCLKCGHRYGWQGKLTDKPACPKCGQEPNREELAKIEKEIEKVFKHGEVK